MQTLVAGACLCVGLLIGGAGSAFYFSEGRAQQDRLLAVALSTQRRVARVENACSERCNCQYPDLGQLRSALYSPLSPALANEATAQPQPAASAPARPEPSAEQLDRAAKAQDLLTAAARSQHWTEADNDRLRELMRGLPSEEHQQISFSLVQLINAGKLRPDEGVTPF